MTVTRPRLHSVALTLDAAQYLQGWSDATGTLFLPALSEARVGDEVAVRIAIFGQVIRATVFGRVALVRRVGRPSLPPGVELTVDHASRPAARFLASAAQGEGVHFRERAPRYEVALTLRLTREGVDREVQTINVSEGGCAVAWHGALPDVGDVFVLKMGEGLFTRSGRAVVCWCAMEGAARRSVGMRVVAEGRAARAWQGIVARAAGSGARTA